MTCIIGAAVFTRYTVTMIDIYKKLPGTNCGQCGSPSCMAFAQKVKIFAARMDECPPLAAAAEDTTAERRHAPSSGNYERVSRDVEKEAVLLDFPKAARAIGGTYIMRDGKESIFLKMIDTEYELSREGLRREGAACTDAWAKLIICDYICRQGEKALTGEWVPLGLFPRTASLVRAFQGSAEKKIAERFTTNQDELRHRCAAVGGREAEGRVKADYSARIDLLPHVPLLLSFWTADEEFDADCKLLFDRSADAHIDIEYLAYLVELFADGLTAGG